MVKPQEIEQVKARIKALNSSVDILECSHAQVDPALLLNIRGFDLEHILRMEPDFLGDGEHQHDTSISSVGFRHNDPVNIGKLTMWINELIRKYGHT